MNECVYVFALPFVHWKVVVYCCTMPNHFFSPPSLSSTSLFPSPPIANPIGLAVAQLASSYIVTSTDRIPMMVRPPPLPACLPASLSLLTLSLLTLSLSHSLSLPPSLPPSPPPSPPPPPAVDLHHTCWGGRCAYGHSILVEQASPPSSPHVRGELRSTTFLQRTMDG